MKGGTFSVYDLQARSSLTSSIIKDEIGNEFAEKNVIISFIIECVREQVACCMNFLMPYFLRMTIKIFYYPKLKLIKLLNLWFGTEKNERMSSIIG